MKKIITTVAAVFAASTLVCQAAWTILPLPDTDGFQNIPIAHLPDGRFIYGHNGKLVRQDSFGNAATTAYTNAPAGDYGFVSPSHVGVAFGGTSSFDSSNPATDFTIRDTTLNVPYAAQTLAGGNLLITASANFGSPSGIFHLSAGGTLTTLVADFSTYSGGITMDNAGNVYAAYAGNFGEPNDGNIYRYSAGQIAAALGGSPLSLGDGTLIGNLGVSSSLAIDSANQRLYATGYQLNGIRVLDLNTNATNTIVVPGFANANYLVTTFSDGSNEYVGWVNRSGYNGGDKVFYGYDLAAAVPEPSGAALLMLAAFSFARRRTRRAE